MKRAHSRAIVSRTDDKRQWPVRRNAVQLRFHFMSANLRNQDPVGTGIWICMGVSHRLNSEKISCPNLKYRPGKKLAIWQVIGDTQIRRTG